VHSRAPEPPRNAVLLQGLGYRAQKKTPPHRYRAGRRAHRRRGMAGGQTPGPWRTAVVGWGEVGGAHGGAGHAGPAGKRTQLRRRDPSFAEVRQNWGGTDGTPECTSLIYSCLPCLICATAWAALRNSPCASQLYAAAPQTRQRVVRGGGGGGARPPAHFGLSSAPTAVITTRCRSSRGYTPLVTTWLGMGTV
jgi:hypothetical protein